MSIDELVPKTLFDRYGIESVYIMRDIVFTIKDWRLKKAFNDYDIKRIYFISLQRYEGSVAKLDELLEQDKTARKRSVKVIDFQDLYKLNGQRTGCYIRLTQAIDKETKEIIDFLKRKSVLVVATDGVTEQYHVNERRYMSPYLQLLAIELGETSVRTPRVGGKRK